MLNEQSRFLQNILLLCDVLAIVLGWIGAYYLRFEVLTFGFFELPLWRPLSRYLDYLPVLVVIWMVLFQISGLYRPKEIQRFYNLVYAVLKAVGLGLIAAFTAIFFYKWFAFSRMHMVLFGLVTSVLMIVSRAILYRFAQGNTAGRKAEKRVLIVGAGKVGEKIEAALKHYPWMGFRVVGFLDDVKTHEPHILGKLSDLATVMDDYKAKGEPIDYVYLALPLRLADDIEAMLDILSIRLAHVYFVPDIVRFNLFNARISDLDGLPMIHLIDETPFDFRRVVKRAMDILGACVLLVFFAPIMILLAIGVKLSSKGAVFYRQERMGLNGKTFDMLKFRSMPITVENESGPVWAKSGESRATPLGAFMRRTSLDELPQFFNVLKGDMSLVGPRPERPFFIDQFKQSVPRYMLRHKMKAGVTGWAQVNGWRGDTSIEKRIEYDLFYIQNWSLKLDIKILFMTIWKGFRDENAY